MERAKSSQQFTSHAIRLTTLHRKLATSDWGYLHMIPKVVFDRDLEHLAVTSSYMTLFKY